MNTNKRSATIAVEAFSNIGGSHVVISPGSRNAPIVKAILNQRKLTPLSVVDERSAAFIALGIALATKKPVAITCTSGTALLNYSPAIAEAYYLGVPIIVLSADRPTDLIDQGVGQCIRQENVFNNFQKGFLSLDEHSNSTVDLITLYRRALTGKPGPVHVNLPFSEPLYAEEGEVSVDFSVNAEQLAKLSVNPSYTIPDHVLSKWKYSKRKMILCACLKPNHGLNDILKKLSDRKDTIVLYETTSNLKEVRGIDTIDRVYPFIQGSSFEPDIVLTIGENIISKRIREYLSGLEESEHWNVHVEGQDINTFGKLKHTIIAEPIDALEQLGAIGEIESEYKDLWLNVAVNAANAHSKFLEKLPFCDLKAFQHLLDKIPDHYHLHSGNSSAVRYIQLFQKSQWKSFHANRGTSGIDGSLSTAIGYQMGTEEPTLLISGDLSFLYDSNGLWNSYVSPSFRIIVINNGGGGIFRFIPGPTTVDRFEQFFEASHNYNLKGIADTFGLSYSRAENEEHLGKELETFFQPDSKPKLLEIMTPAATNAEVLKSYFQHLKNRASENR